METGKKQSTPLTETRLPFLTQFTLVYLLVVVLPIAVAGYVTWTQMRQSNLQRVEDNVAIVGSAKVDEVSTRIFETNDAIESIVFNRDNLQDYISTLNRDDEVAAEQAFENILENYASIVAIKLFNNSGTPIVETGILIDTPRVTLGDLSLVETLPKISVVYGGPGNRPLADLVFIINTNDGRKLGNVVIVHDLSLATEDNIPSLYGALESEANLETLPNTSVYLFSETSIGGQTNRNELIGSSQRGIPLFTNDYADAEPITLTNDDEFKSRFNLAEQNFGAQVASYTSDILGESVIAYVERIGGTRWVLAVEFSEEDASQEGTFLPIILFIASVFLFLHLITYWLAYQRLVPPINRVIERMNTFSFMHPMELPSTLREDEMGQLFKSYNRLTNHTLTQFNQQSDRTTNLSNMLNLIYDLNKVIGVLDIDFILGEMVRQLHEQIGAVDYAQIFMIDEDRQKAILRAGTGDLGRRLVVQDYQQDLNAGGLVSNTVVLNQTQLINDVGKSMEYAGNIRFPNAKSIAVIPAKLRDRVLAVLEIHSFTAGAFTDEDIELFGALASELALVIVAVRGDITHQVDARSQPQYEDLSAIVGSAGTPSPNQQWSELQQRAIFNRMLAVEEDGETTHFALPILLRNEILGAVEWTVQTDQYNNQLVQTANELVGRLGLAIDNARLFDRSQRLIARERKVNEISQKIISQSDIHLILQTAVRELGQALGTGDTIIRLNLDKLTEE